MHLDDTCLSLRTNPSKARKASMSETLGKLMNRASDKESQAAARAFANPAPNLDEHNYDVANAQELKEYGSKFIEKNRYSPPLPAGQESPALDSGELSQQDVYTTSENFSGTGDDDPVVMFKNTSTSYFEIEEGIVLGTKKFTKNSRMMSGEDVLDGHNLLSSEEGGTPAPTSRSSHKRDTHYEKPDGEKRPIAAALYELLLSKNMYHPSKNSPFIDPTAMGEAALIRGIYSHQDRMGEFNPNAEKITVEELGKVGLELLLHAQSESEHVKKAADSFMDKGNFGSVFENMVLFPHATQVGSGTVNVSNLRARIRKGERLLNTDGQDDLILVETFQSSLGAIKEPNTKGISDEDDSLRGLDFVRMGTSYGTLNSPVEQFGGALPVGMLFPVLYAVLLIGLLGKTIPPIVEGLRKVGLPVMKDPENPETYQLGRNKATSKDDLFDEFLEFIGLTSLNETGGWSSVMAGLMLFYGMPKALSPVSLVSEDVLSLFINIVRSPGYYLVVTKRILQDTGKINEAFVNLGQIAGSAGLLQTIAALTSAIQSITSSFTFKFFVVMAKTGAQALKGYLQPGMDGHGTDVVTLQEQKRVRRLTAKNRISMSRIHSGKDVAESTLSLRRHVAALLPNRTTARLGFESREKDAVLSAELAPILSAEAIANRISPEFLDLVEEKIDAEYVPFSIQDLRTNEIFSLPAFIGSITDDFAVQHGNTHGYGRTDPVYTYAKTVRSISLTFNIIAMNKEDHQYMYYVVNKLVAMCYPQRDRGLIRKGEKNLFAQPFSQTPTASPVIRIRLGDLIRNNKSSSAMEKIFGGREVLSLKPTVKNIEEVETKASEKASEESTFRSAVAIARRGAQERFRTAANAETFHGQKLVVPAGTTINILNKTTEKYVSFVSQFDVHTEITGHMSVLSTADTKLFMAQTDHKTHEARVWKVKLDDVFSMGDGDTVKAAYAFGGKTLAHAVHANDSDGSLLASLMTAVGGNGGSGPIEGIITNAVPVKFLDEDLKTNETTDPFAATKDMITNFLDKEKNPIVRAFEVESAGKGLAGVITQLSLSYEGALWGTGQSATENGINAPMRIQVTLGFSPIHDMPLGLDSTGDLFAPSHPVGPLSRASIESSAEKIRERGKAIVDKSPPINVEGLKDPTKASLF